MRHVTVHSHPDPTMLPSGMEALADAIRDLERFRVEQGNAQAKVRELTASRPQAADDDRRAVAQAIRDGKPDPGPAFTQALDLRLAQERNRAEGAAILVAEAEVTVLAALRDHDAEYADLVDRMDQDARAAMASALAVVGAAVAALSTAQDLRAFLDAAMVPTVTTLRAGRGGLRVTGLGRPGDAQPVETVLARLAALADPDPEPEPAADVRPLAPRVGEGVWVSPNG